jgi:hypothetical protein
MDGPTLEWFRIQEDLMTAESHILLLFDCCFAAQAGRARQQRPSRIELLAAAAMGMETPMPGHRSFTMALIRELTTGFKKEGFVIVSDLHRRLVARETELWATPFYMKLGHEQKSIRLERLCESTSLDMVDDANGVSFQLLVKTRAQLDQSNLDEITRWLGENRPPTVATLHVENVLKITNCIHNFIEDVRKGNQPLTKTLNEPVIGDILGAWENAVAVIERVLAEQRDPNRVYRDLSTVQKLAGHLLAQLDVENSVFVDLLERKLLNSPLLVDEAMENTAARTLGIADQLRLRQIICSPERPNFESFQAASGEESASNLGIMEEYKKYGPYTNPAEIPALTKRVSRLAELLSSPKDPRFLSLRCVGWCHKPLEHQYVLNFEIPGTYGGENRPYNTLQSIIQRSRGTARPSLDDRLKIALLLAKAVQKWHSVGWLHQGISSPNVIFFNLKGGKTDYSSPFLGGFEFARPDSDPSIGQSADDVAFNVYRHPARQGDTRKGHRKIHDIYSLGVVLLEIGLWQSGFDIVNSRGQGAFSAQVMQQKLQIAAAERLSHYAGRSYEEAVDVCLSSGFNVDLDDENESQLARSFEKAVIDKLAKGIAVQ